MMEMGGFRVGSSRGIPIRIHVTFLLVLPAFPMDGGRILCAVLTRKKGLVVRDEDRRERGEGLRGAVRTLRSASRAQPLRPKECPAGGATAAGRERGAIGRVNWNRVPSPSRELTSSLPPWASTMPLEM